MSKYLTVIPSRPQSTEVTSAPSTPPGKDMAIPFLRLMVDEELTFWKENIPPKTPLGSQLMSSAKCLWINVGQKAKAGATEGGGIRGKEPALGGSPDFPPKTLPWPALSPSLLLPVGPGDI